MNIGRIKIYSLSANICKKIYEEDMFEIMEFMEDETGETFDIDISKVKSIKFSPGILHIKACDGRTIQIESDEYKEIIIP